MKLSWNEDKDFLKLEDGLKITSLRLYIPNRQSIPIDNILSYKLEKKKTDLLPTILIGIGGSVILIVLILKFLNIIASALIGVSIASIFLLAAIVLILLKKESRTIIFKIAHERNPILYHSKNNEVAKKIISILKHIQQKE